MRNGGHVSHVKKLPGLYRQRAETVASEQLEKAGLRLAVMLNGALAR